MRTTSLHMRSIDVGNFNTAKNASCGFRIKPKAALVLLGLAAPLWNVFCVLASPPIQDPAIFVSEVYRHISTNETYRPGQSVYIPPDDIYTPRLNALFSEYERRINGEVGCLDFSFWLNAQDSSLKNVRVVWRKLTGHSDRRLVIATFVNGRPQELHFEFRLIAGRWLLDDVDSLKDRPWRLSEILKCPL